MKLPWKQFKRVVRDSVLVSLDLLVFSERDEVLVGERRNPPAKGYLFVPGGRIWKGENLGDALPRISTSEVGLALNKEEATLNGVYDHVYRDNAFGESGLITHYVVIACCFRKSSFIPRGQDRQHDELRMMPIAELLAHPKAHPYTRNYFLPDPPNLFLRAGEFRFDDEIVPDDQMSSCDVRAQGPPGKMSKRVKEPGDPIASPTRGAE